LLALITSGPANSVLAGPNADEGEIYLPVFMNNFDPSVVPGSFIGTVVDADQRGIIQGAEVCVAGYCDTTDALGAFELINIPSGSRSLQVTAAGWITINESVFIIPNDTREMFIAMAVDDLGLDVFQIVLTWGPPWNPDPPASAGDLDAHFWITKTSWTTETFHIDASYTSSYGNCDEPPYACYIYDDDVIDGYGPETIVINQVVGDLSPFSVLNYDAGYPGVPKITNTDAVVRVFKGNQHLHTFAVPSSGSGDLWYVFDVKSDGQIESKNCITAYSPLDLPVCPPPDG